jgi:hypothetical protein
VILKAEITSAIFVERLFEKTFTDVTQDSKGNTIYICNPVTEKAVTND